MFFSAGGMFGIMIDIIIAVIVIRILMSVYNRIKNAAEKITKKRPDLFGKDGGKREEAPITQSMTPEDIYHTKIYNRKEKIPADAMRRSAYIAWLVRQGHYEEADRVSSLNI